MKISNKIILSSAIVTGMILYLSKFLRNNFKEDADILFILGFLPNFGLAFALPFIYVGNRIRLKKQSKHFNLACIVTFLLMVLNEIGDKYQARRVFDMLDIYASLVGVISAFLFYHFFYKFLIQNQQ